MGHGGTRAAIDDGEAQGLGEGGDVGLGDLDQGANDLEAAVGGGVARRHGLQAPGVAQVHQEGGQGVFQVVPQRDFVASALLGPGVEHAAAHARAKGTGRLPGLGLLLDSGVKIGAGDVKGNAGVREPVDQGRGIVLGMPRVHVDGVQRDGKGEFARHVLEQVEQGVAVLAAADRHEDAIAGRQQAVLSAGARQGGPQALAQGVDVFGGGEGRSHGRG